MSSAKWLFPVPYVPVMSRARAVAVGSSWRATSWSTSMPR